MKLPTPEEITRSLEELLRRPLQPPARRKGGPPRKARTTRPAREKRLKQVERKPADKKNLLARTITGLSLAGLTILLIVIHPHAFAVEAMFFVAIGIKEMCDMLARNGIRASYFVAMPCAMAIIAAGSWDPKLMGPVVAACAVVTMACMTFRKAPAATSNVHGPIRGSRYIDAVMTIYSFLYVGWLFSFCLQIRLLPGSVAGPNGSTVDAGAAFLLMLITTTALSDVGAYTFGRLFGRHALAPDISPGKTLEGALGGVVFSIISAMCFGWWLGLGLSACAIYGAVVSVFAQLGDLWESLMKREAGVKDSGRALAGHGGVLDRFDSFFFAMPVGYLLTNYLLL